MSAETLRHAAAKLRAGRVAGRCDCLTATTYWFDRSICPEPCGSMHTRCEPCGGTLDRCLWEERQAQPTRYDLAVASLLDALGQELESGAYTVASDILPTWLHCHVEDVAHAYLAGENA